MGGAEDDDARVRRGAPPGPSRGTSTLRPPTPGGTESLRVPADAARSWRPPRQERWASLPELAPPPSAFPPLFLPEDPAPAPRAEDPPAAGADPRREGRAHLAERAVASMDARDTAVPAPLPPDRAQRVRDLVHELARATPEGDGPIRERLLRVGPEALPALRAAFPGQLWVDLERPHRPLREAGHLSACAAALVAFGPAAVPHVASLLRDPDPTVRFGGCVVAADLLRGARREAGGRGGASDDGAGGASSKGTDPGRTVPRGTEPGAGRAAELIRPLAARLLDELTAVRNAAMLALRAGEALPAARALRAELLATLEDRSAKRDWRQKAAWTLGQLRDASATPHLIAALDDGEVAPTAREALVLLTGVDRGRFQFRWRSWWKSHRGRGRAGWLLDALGEGDPGARARAAEELVLLTGEGFEAREDVETPEGATRLAERFRALLSS